MDQLSLFAEPGRRGRWVYRPWITKGGRRIYASQFGLKAFRFWVDG